MNHEIQEWEKKDYINGVRIGYDNLFDLIVEHVEDYQLCSKRDLTENEDKLQFFLFRVTDRVEGAFNRLEIKIHSSYYQIRKYYIRIIETEQHKSQFELNNNLTKYKRQLTLNTNGFKSSVEELIKQIKSKREYQEELFFLQELNDIFDEIKYGHKIQNSMNYVKLAGYGTFRDKPITGSYREDVAFDLKRIKEIKDNPIIKPQTYMEIHEENTKFLDKARTEAKQFAIANILQQHVQTDDNSWYDRNLTCVHCKKEFKSRNTQLSYGKCVSNIVKHLSNEHGLKSEYDWAIKNYLVDLN